MAKPKGSGIFNRTQPVRIPATSLKDVKTYQLTSTSHMLGIGGKREYYATESAPRAPHSFIPGKSYFGWVPHEERIEGTEKKYLQFENPERKSKILWAGPTIFPVQKQSYNQTTEESRGQFGHDILNFGAKRRGHGTLKERVREREYNPADFIPYLNAIEKDKHITINLTGADIKNEEVRDKYGLRTHEKKYEEKLEDRLGELFGASKPVYSKVTRDIINRETGKPYYNPYEGKNVSMTEKVRTGEKFKFGKQDQRHVYVTPEGVVVNMRAAVGENADKHEIRENVGSAIKQSVWTYNDVRKIPNIEEMKEYKYKDKEGKEKVIQYAKSIEPVNWEFTENAREYAGTDKELEDEADLLGKKYEEREEARLATMGTHWSSDQSRYIVRPSWHDGFQQVRSKDYDVERKSEEEPHELAQEVHKHEWGSYQTLSSKPKRKPEAESREYAGSEEDINAEAESLVENMEKD